MIFRVLLFLGVSHLALSDEKVRYDNFTVHRITPRTQEAVEALRLLQEHSDGYDFWGGVSGIDRPVDVMVAPHLKHRFNDIIRSGAYESKVFISNVQELIDNERPKTRATKAFGWSDYYTLDEINQWLTDLSETDDRVELLEVGESYENRIILGVRVVFAPGNADRSVFVESNIHAREWISSAVSTWILNQLLTSTDPAVVQLANSHDWYFVPVFNPDGLVYTHTTDRMWRKTRKPYLVCHGADPNRNWDYQYNNGGTSSFPCSETYRGDGAFSEPSTKTLSDFITTIAPSLEAYISFHSYSQLFLIPYGHSPQHVENYDDLREVGLKAAASLANLYGTEYTVGNTVEILYVASGASVDWVKGRFHTPITYTYELRDTGRYGFILPAEQILPTSRETFASFITIFEEFDRISLSNGNKTST